MEICDVGPRDGLQNDPTMVPPAVRAELCARLAAAGLRRVEAVSFVDPTRVPQMGGAEEVVQALPADEPTVWSALVLNERGHERARAVGVTEIHYAVMATDAFSRRNCNVSTEESLAAAERIIARAHATGARVAATVSVAFGCPFEGAVDPGRVVDIAARLVDMGADELMLADTIGSAAPRHVAHLLDRVVDLGLPIGVHLHNTRNTGYANVVAALDHGATLLEASVGGIGGCPFAPRATGNIATEDLVNLLHAQGVETGIDLDRLISVAAWLAAQLGHPLPGLVHSAGAFEPMLRSRPAPASHG